MRLVRPSSGVRVLAYLGHLWSYLQSIRPSSSGDIRVNYTDKGVTFALVNTPTDIDLPLSYVSADNSASTVSVSAGTLIHGTTKLDIAANASVSVTGGTESSPHYVYVEYTPGSTATIQSTALSTYPTPDASTFRRALFEVYKSGDVIYTGKQLNAGDIVIWGAFAP